VNGRTFLREEGDMSLALKRIKVYLKLSAILAVIAVILLVVLMNLDKRTDVWFFKPYEQVNVLWLILITAVSAIASWWIVLRVFGTLRELRGLRQAREDRQKIDEQQRLARELAEREKRIDEKLRRSITEE
jgi:type VI protein secretion system component VasK